MADLDSLRARIDAIDRDIHDLLIERSRVAQEVAAAKGRRDPALRPGREARILRRLVGRHAGPLSPAVLVRIWREILAGNTAIQGAFEVAVYVPDAHLVYWDLARDHYGSQTPVTPLNDPMAVLERVASGAATAGVVPWPAVTNSRPWWPAMPDLVTNGRPTLVGRLPFVAGSGGGDAAVIARAPFEATGDDRSLLILSDQDGVNWADALTQVGLDVTAWLDRDDGADQRAARFLVEVAGHVDGDDPRLAQLDEVVAIGGYPRPIDGN